MTLIMIDGYFCKRTTFWLFAHGSMIKDTVLKISKHKVHHPRENNAFRWLIHAWLSKNMALLLERHAHLA